MGTMERTLILVRHAKTEPHDAARDLERRLTPRGWDDARDLGRRIVAAVGSADGALVSPATRARETFAAINASLAVGWMRTEARIYGAEASDLLDLARGAGRAGSLLLVGHGPAIWEAGALLASGPLRDELARGVATGTALLVRFDGEWSQLGSTPARLQVLPRARRH